MIGCTVRQLTVENCNASQDAAVCVVVADVPARRPALAQELTGTLKKIKDTGAITLGHRESSVPFSYYDDKQQVVGYAMDLCYQDRRRGEERASSSPSSTPSSTRSPRPPASR